MIADSDSGANVDADDEHLLPGKSSVQSGAGNRLVPTTINLPFSDGDATVDLTFGNANADSLSNTRSVTDADRDRGALITQISCSKDYGPRDSIPYHRHNLERTGRNPERNSRRLFRELADNHGDANVDADDEHLLPGKSSVQSGAGNRLVPTTINLPFSDGDATVDLTFGNANADSLSNARSVSVADTLLRMRMNLLQQQVKGYSRMLQRREEEIREELRLYSLLFDLTQPTVESRHINSLCCPVCMVRYEAVDGTSVLRVKDSGENNHSGGSTTSTQQRNHNDGIKYLLITAP